MLGVNCYLVSSWFITETLWSPPLTLKRIEPDSIESGSFLCLNDHTYNSNLSSYTPQEKIRSKIIYLVAYSIT